MANKALDAAWLDLIGLRGDGRKVGEHRRVDVAIGAARSAHADGSCELAAGLTRVAACAVGPRECARRGDERHDGCALDVRVRYALSASVGERARSGREKLGRELADAVRRALLGCVMVERYPRCEIAVRLSVLVDDGGVLSACVNAASLALVDAGIMLRDVAAAATVSRYQRQIVVDPTRDERRDTAVLDVAVLPRSGAVLFARTDGEAVPFDDLEALLAAGVAAATDVGDVLAEEMRDHVADAVETRDHSADHSAEVLGRARGNSDR